MNDPAESKRRKAVTTPAERADFAAWVYREILLAGRFVVVGLAATLVHMLVVWGLIEITSVPPLLANLLAFLTAFGVSFAGHYLWTFGASCNVIRAMCRLFLVSASAFGVNTTLLASLLGAGWLAPSTAAVLAAAVMPAITFLASRLWAFREAAGKKTSVK